MYPTSRQIMAREVRFKAETIRTVKTWKAEYFRGWRGKSEAEKMTALGVLLARLGYGPYREVGPANFRSFSPLGDCYQRPSGKIRGCIHLSTTSIITALHEFAHHLGMDERGACRWSVWLFRKVFPKSFARLRFVPGSHMLVRQ